MSSDEKASTKFISRPERISQQRAWLIERGFPRHNNYKMETGNSQKNLETLGWDTLEERRLRTKLTIFQKGRCGEIDIPTDHLTLKTRPTRRGGGGPTYQKEF